MADVNGPWDIWFYGTNTKLVTDSNNEVSLSSLPTVSEANGWKKINVQGVKDENINFDGIGEVQGGYFLDSSSQYRTLLVETSYYYVATNDSIINELISVFGYKQKFLCMDGDGQAEGTKYYKRLHTSGKALEVRLVDRQKEWHEDGWLRLTINLRLNKAVA